MQFKQKLTRGSNVHTYVGKDGTQIYYPADLSGVGEVVLPEGRSFVADLNPLAEFIQARADGTQSTIPQGPVSDAVRSDVYQTFLGLCLSNELTMRAEALGTHGEVLARLERMTGQEVLASDISLPQKS